MGWLWATVRIGRVVNLHIRFLVGYPGGSASAARLRQPCMLSAVPCSRLTAFGTVRDDAGAGGGAAALHGPVSVPAGGSAPSLWVAPSVQGGQRSGRCTGLRDVRDPCSI